MASIEQKLKEELERFKQIGNNANNLNEQVLGSVNGGSGFVDVQGPSPRISQFIKRQQELGEQEEEEELDIPADPEAAAEELPGGEEETGEEDLEAEEEGGEEEEAIDTETELDTTDGTEIDVTDLVTGQEEIKKDVKADKDILSKNTDQLNSLLSKLEDLETQLGHRWSYEEDTHIYEED